jgi:hypothetical protein
MFIVKNECCPKISKSLSEESLVVEDGNHYVAGRYFGREFLFPLGFCRCFHCPLDFFDSLS